MLQIPLRGGRKGVFRTEYSIANSIISGKKSQNMFQVPATKNFRSILDTTNVVC